MLTDCHVHLDRYSPGQVVGMLARAEAVGVGLILTAAVDAASACRAIALARRYSRVCAGVGLHPLWVHGPVPARTWARLAALAARPEVVVWSECGLDYREGPASPAEQRAAFRRQLELARGLGLAAIVHVVDAADDALALLTATGMAARAAVHYFTGDRALAERYLAAGLLLSVGKPVIRPANAALRAAVRATPLDRLLLETDTYPLPGRTTEPANVPEVAAAVAALHGVPVETVAATTCTNLARLLGDRFPGPAA